jgi:ribosomal protein L23
MSIIIKPIITEKVTKDGEIFNRFGFVVNKSANKVQIKKAIEETYNVSVVQVKIHKKWCNFSQNKCLQKSHCSSERRRKY